MAREIWFGRQGRFGNRGYEAQLNRASALSLVINALTVWNTRYLKAAAEELARRNRPIPEDAWTHLTRCSGSRSTWSVTTALRAGHHRRAKAPPGGGDRMSPSEPTVTAIDLKPRPTVQLDHAMATDSESGQRPSGEVFASLCAR